MSFDARLILLAAMTLVAADSAMAGSFEYRVKCPEPGTIFGTEAYICATLRYMDLGERVQKAYQAQITNLSTIYDKPEDAEKLQQELAVLEASQKGWERYAVNECAAEGYMAWGGTLEPQLVGQCTQRLAEARIKELGMLLDGLAN